MQSKPPATPDAASTLRKRKQNRISQQCLREKKSAAASSFFDKLAADIRALRDGCERAGQVDAARLLEVNEGLVEENRQLREAVLRMRKKLLSLSSAADCAADDPIFQKMLAKEPEAVERGSNRAGVPPNKRRKRSTSSARNGRADSSDASAEGLYGQDGAPFDEPVLLDVPGDSSDSVNSSTRCQTIDPIMGAEGQPDYSFFLQGRAEKDACPAIPAVDKSPNQFYSACTLPIATLPQLSMPNTAMLDAWINRSCGNFTAQKIENACIRYALKSRAGQLNGGDGIKQGPSSKQTVDRDMVDRLADIAVHMMFDDVGLGRFINTLEGARDFLKSVLSCRIILGCAKPPDVLDDLDTDCPPWATSTRPVVVDMIAWPSLRDQMIFHSSFYDLDEMTEDVINNTVVDIPEKHIALQMYSHPPNPFSNATGPESENSEQRFRFSSNEYTLRILQLQNQELYDIISRRMESRASDDGTASPCSGLMGCLPSECTPARTKAAKKFKGWKLSNAFFKKYPFLQCSSLASPYPFCPSSKLANF